MDNCKFSESSQWFRRCFAENIKLGCFLNLPSVMHETLGQDISVTKIGYLAWGLSVIFKQNIMHIHICHVT